MITNIYERATLDDTFEFSGRWWLPEKPEEQVRGTVRFDRGRELIFTFSGSLGNLNPKILCGWCSGVECKLLNLTYFSHSSSRGETISTTLSAHFLLVGGQLDSHPARFAFVRVNYSNMDSWMRNSPIPKALDSQHGLKLEISLERPEPLESYVAAIPARIRIEHELPYSIGASLHVDHRVYFIVLPEDEQDTYGYQKIISTLQEVLSLVSAYPCRIIEILAFSRSSHPGEQPVPTRIYAVQPSRSEVTSIGMLQVRFDDIKHELGTILQRWFDIAESHRPVYGPLLGTIFHPMPYAETEFLSIIHALEGFHRREFNGFLVEPEDFTSHLREIASSLPSTLPSTLRSAVLQKLKYGNERSLRSRLKELIQNVPQPIREALCKDPKQLVSEIADMRNDQVHRPLEADMGFAASQRLIELMLKARFLLTVLMFQRIGVSATASPMLLNSSRLP